MTKLTKSIEIEASPEKVFALILDVEKMNEINQRVRRVRNYL